jgi:CheY-like chemotaxis protein
MSFPILVVDDDVEDHMIMQEYFEDMNYRDPVKFVINGLEAIKYLESQKKGLLPQLIILDLNMPMMNGTQTLVQIKRDPDLKNIPVIIYSTSENETEKRKTLSLGAMEYVVKPLNFEEGSKMIAKFLTYLS